MPLYEFECTKCRNKVETSLRVLEKKRDKKTVASLVDKHDNINAIEVVDLSKNKVLAKHGVNIVMFINQARRRFKVPHGL